MLFNRRKAEIEVLANSRSPKNISISVPESQMSNLNPPPTDLSGIPLIRYLVHKLNFAIMHSNSEGLQPFGK